MLWPIITDTQNTLQMKISSQYHNTDTELSLPHTAQDYEKMQQGTQADTYAFVAGKKGPSKAGSFA